MTAPINTLVAQLCGHEPDAPCEICDDESQLKPCDFCGAPVCGCCRSLVEFFAPDDKPDARRGGARLCINCADSLDRGET